MYNLILLSASHINFSNTAWVQTQELLGRVIYYSTYHNKLKLNFVNIVKAILVVNDQLQ